MQKHALPWPTENPRARGEWDFRTGFLSKQEVWWCHVYELGRIRQTTAWRESIQKFRRENGGDSYSALWIKAQEYREATMWPCIFYTLWPEWPFRPYLSVSPAERKKRIADWCRGDQPEAVKAVSFQELFVNDRYALACARVGFVKLPAKLEIEDVGETLSYPGGEIIPFQIPDYLTDRELKDQLDRWVELRRKKRRDTPEETRGAGAPVTKMRADLCAVGFWRLVRSGMTRQ